MLRNSLLKKCVIISLVLMLIPIIGGYKASYANQPIQQMTFGTMSPTGGYMMLALGIAKIINENVEGVNLTPVPEPLGSVGNVRAIDSREREFGLAKCDVVLAAKNVTEPFTKKQDVMSWFNAHFAILYVFATESSGIKTYKDFEGKKVAIGLPGGSNELVNINVYLPLAGVDVSKVKLQGVSASTAINLMKDGHIDALMYAGAPKLAMYDELASSRKVRYIPMDTDTLNKVVNKVKGFYIREYTKDSFSKEINAGAILDEQKVKLHAMPHIVLVSPDVDEETMYKFTKAVFEHLQVIYDVAPTYKVIKVEDAIKGLTFPVHPGAIRYYKEVGIVK